MAQRIGGGKSNTIWCEATELMESCSHSVQRQKLHTSNRKPTKCTNNDLIQRGVPSKMAVYGSLWTIPRCFWKGGLLSSYWKAAMDFSIQPWSCDPEVWLLSAYLISYVVVQHSDNGSSFTVGYGIEDLVHLRGVAHVYLPNRQATECHSPDLLHHNIPSHEYDTGGLGRGNLLRCCSDWQFVYVRQLAI